MRYLALRALRPDGFRVFRNEEPVSLPTGHRVVIFLNLLSLAMLVILRVLP